MRNSNLDRKKKMSRWSKGIFWKETRLVPAAKICARRQQSDLRKYKERASLVALEDGRGRSLLEEKEKRLVCWQRRGGIRHPSGGKGAPSHLDKKERRPGGGVHEDVGGPCLRR